MNDVVQFTYGEDGLDPACMEGKEKPLDIERLFHHLRVKQCCIFYILFAIFKYLIKYLRLNTNL